MPGTIPEYQIRLNLKKCLMPNGDTYAYRISENAVGGMGVSFFVKWSWDKDYTPLGGYNIGGDEDTVRNVLTSGGLWDTGSPTWRELENGASYVSPLDPSGHVFTGIQAVSRRFDDWLVGETDQQIEQATAVQWFKNTLLVQLQQEADWVFTGLVRENPPADPPTAQEQFPPQSHAIQNAVALLAAEAGLLTAAVDPANPTRLLVGAIDPPS